MRSFTGQLFGWIAALAVTQALAIPTNFGGFINARGNERRLPVEEWFRDAKRWLAGADLPGTWSSSAADPARLTLEHPGAVFGIAARSVMVLRDPAGAVKEVVATYDETTSKKPRPALLSSLRRNIGVFTGATARKQADGGEAFSGDGVTVILTASGGVSAKIIRA